MLALLFATIAAAACPEPGTLYDLAAAMHEAESALGADDLAGFAAARSRAAELLPCVGEPVTPPAAAFFHRLAGYAAFLDQDRDGTVASFRAAALADPKTGPSPAVAPEKGAMRRYWTEARAAGEGRTVALPAVRYVEVRVDGSRSDERPLDRPAIVQVLRGSTPVSTFYLPADAALDAWPDEVARADATAVRTRRRWPVAWTAVAGGAALASVGLYSLAHGMEAAYLDVENPPVDDRDELSRLRRSTNTAAAASIGFGAVALGATAVVVVHVGF